MRTVIAFTMLAVLLVGCVTGNPVVNCYRDLTTSIPQEKIVSILEPPSKTPQIIATANYADDLRHLREKGYTVIGISYFTWTGTPSKGQLTGQAKKVGADIVIYSSKYSHTETGERTELGVIPGTTSTTTASAYGSANANGSFSSDFYGNGFSGSASGTSTASGSANYYGSSTTKTAPQFYSYNVPYSARVNAYRVGFLRKHKRFVLGVITLPLPEKMRAELQRNTGALVSLVVQDSPAFKANILTGDIITAMGGQSVGSPEDIHRITETLASQEVGIMIIRNGKEQELRVKLNPPAE